MKRPVAMDSLTTSQMVFMSPAFLLSTMQNLCLHPHPCLGLTLKQSSPTIRKTARAHQKASRSWKNPNHYSAVVKHLYTSMSTRTRRKWKTTERGCQEGLIYELNKQLSLSSKYESKGYFLYCYYRYPDSFATYNNYNWLMLSINYK